MRRDARFGTAHVTDENGAEFGEHVMFDGTSWFHVTRRGKQWLLHGSTMSSGSALYVFMEHPEARHAQLESAIPHHANAADVYADWLEEQGDPFGAALKPALAKERGPAGLWWLEGFERSGAVTVTLRDGFVREASVGAIPSEELLNTVHRVCHMRACLALERLTIDPRALGYREWSAAFRWTMWTECRWPSTLKTLAFGPPVPGQGRPGRQVLTEFQARMAKKYPSLQIEA